MRPIVAALAACTLVWGAPHASAAAEPNAGGADSYVPYQAQFGVAPQGMAVAGLTGIVTLPGSNAVSLFTTCLPKSCLPGPGGAPIPVGSAPAAVAMTSDAATAYVSNAGSGTVSVIANARVTGTIVVGGRPAGLALGGSRLYVAINSSGTVAVADPASGTVVGTIPVGGAPSGVAASASFVYVGNTADATVTVISISSGAVVATIPVGSVPGGIAVSPDGSRAYVANNASASVSVIDTATNSVVATIPVGVQPWGIAVTQDGGTAFVTNYGDGTVSVIDTASRRVVGVVTVGAGPFGVATFGSAASGGSALVANSGGTTVAAIALGAPTNAPEWSANRRTRTVTGVVATLTPAVEYAITARRGAAVRTGTCVAGPAQVRCSVRLAKGLWRVSVTTRLPWQAVAGGNQNKVFRF